MQTQVRLADWLRPILFLFFCVAATNVSAAVVTWTFQNAFWDDGGTITGSFDYDADTDIYSNINITTTDGGGTATVFGASYTGTSHSGSGNTTLVIYSDSSTHPLDAIGEERLDLAFFGPAPDYDPLTNAGGTYTVDTISAETLCIAGTCGFGEKDDRYISSGTIFGVAAVVPVPAAAWLFASALGLIGWTRRKTP